MVKIYKISYGWGNAAGDQNFQQPAPSLKNLYKTCSTVFEQEFLPRIKFVKSIYNWRQIYKLCIKFL